MPPHEDVVLVGVSPDCIASNVLLLKRNVPTSCVRLLQQSIRFGSKRIPKRRRPWPPGPWSAFTVSRYWSAAAVVKKIEPTKKTPASAADPISSTSPGNGPTRKQVEPIAKSTPIHQETRPGAHHTPCRGCARERSDARLRWRRDDQSASAPSGRRNTTCVVKGPTALRLTSVQPSGVEGYATG